MEKNTAVKELKWFDPKLSLGQNYPSDSYVAFTEKGKLGFKDANGNVVIQPQFKALSDVETKFSEDRAFVKS